MARILVVDDELQVTRMMARVLSRAGHQVVTMTSGASALEALDRVDLLISDVRMASMSGTELVATARQRRPELPCCLMSGYDDMALQSAEVAFLNKPFSREDLLGLVQRILG